MNGGEEKDIAIIVAGGRTGTKFFAEAIPQMVPACCGLHEPDVLHLISENLLQTWASDLKKLRTFGLYHAGIGKLIGQTGIRCLSNRHLMGKIDDLSLIKKLKQSRQDFFAHIEAPLIVESSAQWIGLLDVIPTAFPGTKIVGLIRDPRMWVSSWLSHGGRHDRWDLISRLGLSRLDSAAIASEGNITNWGQLGTVERLCWDWRLLALLFQKHLEGRDFARIVRFEDIFESSDRKTHFHNLLEFVTTFEGRKYDLDFKPELLDLRVNESPNRRGARWDNWTKENRACLERICGDWMERFGYT